MIVGMIVGIDKRRCMGHGRCYAVADALFTADADGYGLAVGDGRVPAHLEERALLAVANCPEHAVTIGETTS